MAKIFKPIFQCDGCGTEFDDPDRVRIFKDIVLNGNETKQYIKLNQMYCINCLPLSLDFENKNPETVQVIDLKKETEKSPLEFKVEKLETQLNELISSLQSKINNESNVTENENFMYVKGKKYIKPTELDTVVEKILQPENSSESIIITSQEPETLSEDINSETKEEVTDDQIEFGEDSGKYLILKWIANETHEKKFAQQLNQDIEDLREKCGLKTLIGLYYSTNKYINNLSQFHIETLETQKIINKIFFGIPNIVPRDVFVDKDSDFAFIDKDSIEDRIEPLKIEIPEVKINIKSNTPEVIIPENSKHLIPDIKKDISKRNVFQKKTFSSKNIGDDYI